MLAVPLALIAAVPALSSRYAVPAAEAGVTDVVTVSLTRAESDTKM